MKVPFATPWRGLLMFAALDLMAGPLAAETANAFVNTGYFGTVAIRGYDTVAYFTDGQAVAGDPAISTAWLGADWHFVNEDHRAKFIDNPVAFAPQYGGLCSDGVAYDTVTVNIDPEAWRIIEGKLYLNYDKVSAAHFEETAGLVAKADEYWPTMDPAAP